MQPREKKNVVVKIVYNHLLASGRFYFDPSRQEGHWFDSDTKQLWSIESQRFTSFLSVRLCLNRKDSVYDWIVTGIFDRASQKALRVTPIVYSFFDESKSLLYLNNKPGRILRISADSVTEIDNGDGALFLWDEEWEPFEYRAPEPGVLKLRKLIYERHSLESDGPGTQQSKNLSFDELTLLLDVFIQSIVFRSIILHRPILLYIGPFGCGKTLMQMLIGIVLFGRNFQVLGLEDQKQDAAVAYVTNCIFGVLDNADEKIKWLPDFLARLATGQKIPRRKYYTTNELIKYLVDCIVGVTARTTPWARPDVISRLLVVDFTQPKHYLDENMIRGDVVSSRQELVSEIVASAQNTIRRLAETETKTYESQSRLAGFYRFGMRTSPDPLGFDIAFSKAMGLQISLAAEQEESLLVLLRSWVEIQLTVKEVSGKDREWTPKVTTSRLLAELNQISKNEGMDFRVRNTNTLSRRIKENSTMIKSQGIDFEVNHGSKGTEWQFRFGPNKKNERTQPKDPSDPSLLSGDDTSSRDRNDRNDGKSEKLSGSETHPHTAMSSSTPESDQHGRKTKLSKVVLKCGCTLEDVLVDMSNGLPMLNCPNSHPGIQQIFRSS